MGTSRVRVLLVEDQRADAVLITRLLGRQDFDVERAERLSAALDRLAAEPFDVVLMDLSLPDARGLDAFIEARLAVPDVPVVVLTGLDDEAVAARAVQAGAQDYLVKGNVDARALSRAIRYAIERHRAVSLHDDGIVAERAEAMRAMSLRVAHSIEQPLAVLVRELEVIQNQLGADDASDCATMKKSCRSALEAVKELQSIARALDDAKDGRGSDPE